MRQRTKTTWWLLAAGTIAALLGAALGASVGTVAPDQDRLPARSSVTVPAPTIEPPG